MEITYQNVYDRNQNKTSTSLRSYNQSKLKLHVSAHTHTKYCVPNPLVEPRDLTALATADIAL